jgi:serine/threonine protein phosphatase PrpC
VVWLFCSQGNSLDSPITTKDSEIYHSSTGLIVGSTGMQGWRLEMEDAHVSIDIPEQPDHLFLAVFDGHAGAGAAKFAAQHIIRYLTDTDDWKAYKSGKCQNIELLGNAMTRAFVVVDEYMKQHQHSTDDTSGCTSVTAIITPKHIICANAGDSRCVLGTEMRTKPLSEDHKPYDEIERQRIENAGGFVQWNRVDGDLAVSRALGDFSFKNRPDFHAKDQKVGCLLLL